MFKWPCSCLKPNLLRVTWKSTDSIYQNIVDNSKKYQQPYCKFKNKRMGPTVVHLQLLLEAAAQRFSVKKVFLEISQSSQENACARVSLLIKLRVSGLFSSGVFLWTLWIFQEHHFYRTPPVAASVLFL